MEKANESLELILTIPNVKLFSIVKAEKELKETGCLNIYSIPSQKIIILTINDFKYALNEQIPFMVNDESESTRRYAFPYLNSNMGITFSQDTPADLIEIFELILSENTNFVCPSKEIQENFQTDDGKAQMFLFYFFK